MEIIQDLLQIRYGITSLAYIRLRVQSQFLNVELGLGLIEIIPLHFMSLSDRIKRCLGKLLILLRRSINACQIY